MRILKHILFLSALAIFPLVMPVHSGTISGGKIILASVFPVYQIVRNITEGSTSAEVMLMLPSGLGCPHNYVITPGDINKIRHADIIVINGLGLDDFILDTVKKIHNNTTIIDGSEGIENLITADSHHNHVHNRHGSSSHGHDTPHNTIYNPHLFASPMMVGRMALNIAAALAANIPSDASLFISNGKKYKEKMDTLAEKISDTGRHVVNKQIVAQHDIFDYMARDMGLIVIGLIQNHPGHDPSPSQVISLIKKIAEKNAGTIFIEPQYPTKLGQMIAKETHIPIIKIDPAASGPENARLDFFETTMSQNIKIIMEALGENSE